MANQSKKIILIAPLIIAIILVGELIVLAQMKSKIEVIANQPWQSLKWSGHKIEEKIVLDAPELVQKAADKGILFELDTNGLSYKDVNKGVWYFYDRQGEPIFRIPKSHAIDAKGNFTNDVSIKIFDQENKGTSKTMVQLTIEDKNWLASPSRVLPITIALVLEVVPEKR